MTALKFIAIIVISYLLGSANFSIIFSRRLLKKDIRTDGSKNAGATNMLRTNGKKYAFMTFACDIGKLLIAVGIAYLIMGAGEFNANAYLYKSIAGLACVFGHMYPCYFGFKGGKGVSVCTGMVIVIDWRIALILFVIFVAIVAITKYVSLGSIVIAVLYPILTYFLFKSETLNLGLSFISDKWFSTLVALLFAAVVIIKHRANIVRLCKGTEGKITKKELKK